MSNSDLYSNYIRREPHERSQRFIRNWHKKLLKHALSDSENLVKNVLEIGPGHGYFAAHVVNMGMKYEFVDTSPAVDTKMKDQGFDGHLGTVSDFLDSSKKFDLIWLSHVLEHSPTWVDARQLLSDVAGLLSPRAELSLSVRMHNVGDVNSGMLMQPMAFPQHCVMWHRWVRMWDSR